MQKNSLEVTNIWRSYEFFQPIKHYENSFNPAVALLLLNQIPKKPLNLPNITKY